MMQPSSRGRKQTLLLIVFAYSMLIVLLTYVSTFMPSPSNGTPPSTVTYAIGIVALCVAAAMSFIVMRPNSPLLGGRFQSQMLVCLAMSEFAAIVGFLGKQMSGAPMWPLAAGSLLVNLVFILPRVLAYCRTL